MDSSRLGGCREVEPPSCAGREGEILTVCLVAHAQDDLRRPVVARDHVRGHQEARGGGPGQTEVQDLQSAVGLHHDVAGLQILEKTHTTRWKILSTFPEPISILGRGGWIYLG